MSHTPVQAIIMAGGQGTRLRPYTYVLPKPLVPVGEYPILEYILRQLAQANVDRVTIVVGYKAEMLQTVIGTGDRFGLKIEYFKEDKPLGTMGALSLLPDLDENFLVMNGDLCTNLDFRSFFEHHCENPAFLTVASYHRTHCMEFGVLDIATQGHRIEAFREKPTLGLWVSMGIYALQKKSVAFIPPYSYFGFDNLMHALLAADKKILSYPFSGCWYDIGRPDDYFYVQDAFDKNGLELFGLKT